MNNSFASACDIVMLTWNQLEATQKCIASFLESTSLPCRLIIIDNASTDGTREYLTALPKTGFHVIEVIFNKENAGYAKGVNQGLALAKAPFVCLANNDLVFTQGWLEEILAVFEKDNHIGMLNPNNGNEVDAQDRGNLNTNLDELQAKYKGVFAEQTFCIGFCMVVRREVIQKIGCLSEEFSPFFFEDTDYSMRALKAGYLIGVAKGAFVWHKEHVSLNALKEKKKEEIFARNKKIFEDKWGRILRILLVSDHVAKDQALEREAVQLARNANYVWIMSDRNLPRRTPYDHFNVQFISVANSLDILARVLFKKKRYDVIITGRRFLYALLRGMGFNAFLEFNEEKINEIKYNKTGGTLG